MDELIIETGPFQERAVNGIESEHLTNYPIVYILHNNRKKPAAYIGQTVQAARRLRQHLADDRRSKLDQQILIGHRRLNQSATYNIESRLINLFIADSRYELQNVSQTASRQMHNYYDKVYYNDTLFRDIWERLRNEDIVEGTIDALENKDVYKLSPYKELTPGQLDVKERVLDFCRKHAQTDGHRVFIVEGDAGTGKSVLLSSLFNTIQDAANEPSSPLHQTENRLLVNHGEMLKTYKSMTGSLPNLKKKHFDKPTSFINKMDKHHTNADIVLVDEAHLLLSKPDAYNNFHYDNQLQEIIKRSRVTIVIFDRMQVLKLKSYWNDRLMEEITGTYRAERMRLTDQMRMNIDAPAKAWIDAFVAKELKPIPDRADSSFQLQVFAEPDAFRKEIEAHNEAYGLARIVSTFDYLHKKDGADYLVDETGLNMPWNRTQDDVTWAEQPETIYEVGSIYTVQGFDLNYTGVVLGPSIRYDKENDRIRIDTSAYRDTGAFQSRNDMTQEEIAQVKEQIILNSLNVLMKRGIHGLCIYPTDPCLRERMLELQEERQ
ncbi:DNA/RNA helicase domain-containing protein [Bacillus daqingensis]|uniref:DNA/RNA helicase domain-containing protein n=1 Tax=Bacillus daqingensis TaxID=872396 RepID=A0ABV9NUB9_9BACI